MKNSGFHIQLYFISCLLFVTLGSYAGVVAHCKFGNRELQPPGTSVTNLTICNNQLPYQWNGITCLVAGTYSAILTTSSGTDSTAVLNLSVINVGTSISNAVICTNELPYSWNGQTYTTGGTYSVTLTSNNGCDSVPILSLTVNNVVTSISSISVCSNQLPYTWNGNSYNSSGLYTVTLSSVAGCDSIATLNLVVKPTMVSTSSVNACINSLPYNWNGLSITAPGNYPVHLIASNGCDSVATLQLSISNLTSSTTTATVCNNDLPFIWNGNTYNSSGTYSVNLLSTNNCDSMANLVLIVKPLKTSISFVTICTRQLPYQWNGNSYSSAGIFNLTLPASNGCDSIARLVLTVKSFFTSSVNASICNNALPYFWNGSNYYNPGTYSANYVTAAGCDSNVTLTLSVFPPSTGTDSIIVCPDQLPFVWQGQTFTAAGTYPMNPPVVINQCRTVDTLVLVLRIITPTTTVVQICSNELPYSWNGNNYVSSGLFGVNLQSSAGCDSLTQLDLTVLPVPQNTVSVNTCVNALPYIFNGQALDSSGIYTANITAANGCDSIVTINLNVLPVVTSINNLSICNSQIPFVWNGNTYSATGTYQVTLTATSGCDSIATLNLDVQEFLSSTTIVSVCGNQMPYQWNGNDYTVSGSYNVSLPGANGCDSVATLLLNVNNAITSVTEINICQNQLPYNWNGNTYNNPGVYEMMFVTEEGCDSVAALHLNVGGIGADSVTITICNNQLPYNWNGNSYAVAGVFPATLVSSSGCDSLVILSLIVTDILTSTTNVTVCPVMLPFSWNGNNYNSGGTYSVTLSNSNGCDSVPILSLTISPYVESETVLTICSSQLPYSWNGQLLNSAGNFNVLLTGQGSCDSIAHLQLTVIESAFSTTNVRICEQSLPFSWNNNIYDTAGIYSDTFTAANGCDSFAILNLAVAYPTSSETITNICASQLPYSWNGNIYPVAGVYTVTFSNAYGCDSLATLILSAAPVLTGMDSITICSSQLPFVWNGNTYSVSGDYSASLQSSAGCDSIALLHLTATPIINTITSLSVCENQFPVVWSNNSYNGAGTYSLPFTSAAGCDSVSTLILTSIPVQSTTVSQTICQSQAPFIWNGQAFGISGSYIMHFASAAGCDSVVNLLLQVNNTVSSFITTSTCENQLPFMWNGLELNSSGIYLDTLQSVTGCDSIATLTLQVYPVPVSETNRSVCSGALPYIWNGMAFNSGGTHTVILTSINGCDSMATLNLTILPTPGPPLPGNSPVYCQYETTVPLSAAMSGNADQLLWFSQVNQSPGSPIAPIPSSLVPGIATYYVSQVLGACEGPPVVIKVTVNRKPDLGEDTLLRICSGQFANPAALYDTSNMSAVWRYNGITVPAPDHVNTDGIYELISITDQGGCADTVSVLLATQPIVIADAGPDATVETNYPYQLQGFGNGKYQWSPSHFLNNTFIANPQAVIAHDQQFILMVTDEIGCFALDSVFLRVLNGPSLYVPTAFTPNGDGLNDLFAPTPVGISRLEFFRVFNRMGELVFETKEIGKGWDGYFKGKKQGTGNYVWSLKAVDRFGTQKIMKGNVVLLR